MTEVFDFFREEAWARWVVGLFFLLIVARKQTLRLIRGKVINRAVKVEVSTYEVLRSEILNLNTMLKELQRANIKLKARNESLQKMIDECKKNQ